MFESAGADRRGGRILRRGIVEKLFEKALEAGVNLGVNLFL